MSIIITEELTRFLKEYEEKSKEETIAFLTPLMENKGVKDIQDATGITYFRLYYYFVKEREKPPFDVYFSLLLAFVPASMNTLYTTVHNIEMAYSEFLSMGLKKIKSNMRKVVDKYGFEQVSSYSGVKEGTVHYFFRPQCKSVCFTDYIKVMDVPSACLVDKSSKKKMKKDAVNERLAVLKARMESE